MLTALIYIETHASPSGVIHKSTDFSNSVMRFDEGRSNAKLRDNVALLRPPQPYAITARPQVADHSGEAYDQDMKNSNISRRFVFAGLVVALAVAGCGDANYKKAREQIDANPLNANLSEEQKDKLAKQMAEAQTKADEALKQASGK